MTNHAVLHAIDVLYLGNFRQTLFHKVLHAQLELRDHLRHAEALAHAMEISPCCRKQYAKIIEQLSAPVDVLDQIANSIYDLDLSSDENGEIVQWGLIEASPEEETRATISRLDAVEQETIKTLNNVGKALVALPAVKASWNQWARLRVFYTLKAIPERPCYKTDSIVRFSGSPPFVDVYCFAKPPVDTESDPASHYLLDPEFMPLIWLSLLNDVEVDVEIKLGGNGRLIS